MITVISFLMVWNRPKLENCINVCEFRAIVTTS